MQPGLAELLPPRPMVPRTICVLWRLQGPSRIIAARIERHPFGRELIIAFEGARDDVLETRFERVNFSALDQRAEELRTLLVAKGWAELRTANQVRGH